MQQRWWRPSRQAMHISYLSQLDKGSDWGGGNLKNSAKILIYIIIMHWLMNVFCDFLAIVLTWLLLLSNFVYFFYVLFLFRIKYYQLYILRVSIQHGLPFSFVSRHYLGFVKRYKCGPYWHFSILFCPIFIFVCVFRV